MVLSKVLELLGTLREQGESFPSPQISLLLGMASIATFFIGSLVTASLVLVRRSKVRVI